MALQLVRLDQDTERIAALLDRSVTSVPKVEKTVADIIADVRARGDEAVRELTEKFDRRSPVGHNGMDLSYEIAASEWQRRAAEARDTVRVALEQAAVRIRAFHAHQVEEGYEIEDAGVRLGLRVSPMQRVGIYVPGGTALYPSSVLMTAIPARVAGVEEIVMVTPGASPETLTAAEIAGVDRVFEIGGAQAVAALAYGTQSVPRVDKIVGPGNQWVAAAKRQVFGIVDIDSVAGPSEVLIIADDSADPSWLAADLLAQAEHDVEARPILVTTDEATARAVAAEVERQLATLPRADIARSALQRYGAAVIAGNLEAAVQFANDYAPEHLGVHVQQPHDIVDALRTSGSLFIGSLSPEAAGDYMAGPNHVLPTGGAARHASPLGVYDFRKRTSIIEYSRDGLAAQADAIRRLAAVEGLDAHGRSVEIRVAPSGAQKTAAADT